MVDMSFTPVYFNPTDVAQPALFLYERIVVFPVSASSTPLVSFVLLVVLLAHTFRFTYIVAVFD